MQYCSDENNIYSVYLIISYIEKNKPKTYTFETQKFLSKLKLKDWGPISNIYSPIDVLNNKNNYIDEYNRIINSDLKYPIVLNENHNIVDGMHRLTKAYLLNEKYIQAYIFDKELMEKFIVSKMSIENWNNCEFLTSDDLDKIYQERFNSKNLNNYKYNYYNIFLLILIFILLTFFIRKNNDKQIL